MPPSPRPPRPPKGITFTVRPKPGLTKAESLARRVRALEALLAPRPQEPPGDGQERSR